MTQSKQKLLLEFLRYALVGGIAFAVDAGTLALFKQLFFRENCTSLQMAICVAAGFLAGLSVNYLLSSKFVFRSQQQKQYSQKKSSFFIYTAVGVIGLCLTELLMWISGLLIGNDGYWYLLAKCFVAGLVLIWNYVGRKIFVYHGQ